MMKYGFNLSNVSFGEGKTNFRIDSVKVDLEMEVSELKAQYDFGIALVNAIKATFLEVSPVVSGIIKEHDSINYQRQMQRIDKEMEAEDRKQQNWRERHGIKPEEE